MKLKDAVCIVTGSATGTGAACAVQLARKGARVVVNYTKSEKEARETLAQCQGAGGEAILVQGDVALDADCRKLAQAALDKWGRIDGLVNNAGITRFAAHADLDALGAEDFQRLYAVNVIGPYQMVRACVPAMKKQGNASIVNVSSISGVRGIGSSVAYVASKGALNAMTLSLARALGPEIRVNAICPGLIETRWHLSRFSEADYAKFKANYEKTVPLAKAASADDVAEVAVWLLEGAAQVTGETILVDGGLHLGK
ncbi:MAG TPA: glucose 1-dehydrogenase [Burkholderiales bacterium]|jgi:3-oxoacyl-[acyl-carrier protein] reductase|nr:glucose 1-dehydrogenase [Burkholderiales bacterium]